jgi:hypothetical protein
LAASAFQQRKQGIFDALGPRPLAAAPQRSLRAPLFPCPYQLDALPQEIEKIIGVHLLKGLNLDMSDVLAHPNDAAFDILEMRSVVQLQVDVVFEAASGTNALSIVIIRRIVPLELLADLWKVIQDQLSK